MFLVCLRVVVYFVILLRTVSNFMSGVETDKSMSGIETDKSMSGVETDKSMSGIETDKSMSGVETDKSMSGIETDKSMSGRGTDKRFKSNDAIKTSDYGSKAKVTTANLLRYENWSHFQNSCLQDTTASVYSCAIDCFLEISHAIFLQHLIDIPCSDFFEIVFNSINSYQGGKPPCSYRFLNSRESSTVVSIGSLMSTLNNIREPVWNYLINNCNSFINRSSNAQFSQVFSSNVFNSLTNDENSIFQTTYSVKGYCDTCHCDINANSCVDKFKRHF